VYTGDPTIDISVPAASFNVAENLRAYAPGGPGYRKYYGWRQTIETTTANPMPGRSSAAAAASLPSGTTSTKSAGRS
jgi:hypothetical protein